MSFLFRRSIKVGKYAKINLSSKGVSSVSFGTRGARIGVNSKGVYLGSSIPGTGLSGQHYISKSSNTRNAYQVTIENKYLGVSKIVKGATKEETESKALQQLQIWADREDRERKKAEIANLKEQCDVENFALQAKIEAYNSILTHTLLVDDKIDWDGNKMPEKYPESINRDYFFRNVPKESFWEKIFVWLKKKRLLETEKAEIAYESAKKEFDIKKAEYEKDALEYNGQIDAFRKDFEAGDSDAIIEYATKVLDDSEYVPEFVKDFSIEYDKESTAMLIEYIFPGIEDIPNIKEVKFVKSSKEIKEVAFKKAELSDFYDGIVCQLSLRIIHEIFESIYTDSVKTVILNGIVSTADKATGEGKDVCIISVMANKDAFEAIKLDKVEPVDCLRGLNARMSTPFIKLTEVEKYSDLNQGDMHADS